MKNPGRFLMVPPARRNHELKGYGIEHIQKLYAPLGSQAIRDVLCLQAKSGMHGTEVDRLASGDGKIAVLKDQTWPTRPSKFVASSLPSTLRRLLRTLRQLDEKQLTVVGFVVRSLVQPVVGQQPSVQAEEPGAH